MKFPKFKDYDSSSVRLYTSGGDALGAETLKSWTELTGQPIWEGLGGYGNAPPGDFKHNERSACARLHR